MLLRVLNMLNDRVSVALLFQGISTSGSIVYAPCSFGTSIFFLFAQAKDPYGTTSLPF